MLIHNLNGTIYRSNESKKDEPRKKLVDLNSNRTALEQNQDKKQRKIGNIELVNWLI